MLQRKTFQSLDKSCNLFQSPQLIFQGTDLFYTRFACYRIQLCYKSTGATPAKIPPNQSLTIVLLFSVLRHYTAYLRN